MGLKTSYWRQLPSNLSWKRRDDIFPGLAWRWFFWVQY